MNSNHMTHEEVEMGLKNIGYPVDCGACMEIFYTGMTRAWHDCSKGDNDQSAITIIITEENS